MGGAVSQSVNTRQEILNNVYQNAQTMCAIGADQVIDGTVIIADGLDGDITIQNSLLINDSSCNLSASLSNVVDNLLETAVTQKDFSIPDITQLFKAGTSLDIATGHIMKNNIVQSSVASCKIGGDQTIRNTYVFSKAQTGDIVLQNNEELNNANCVVTNAVSSSVKNKGVAEASQSTTTIGGIVAIAAIIAIVVVIGIIGFAIFAGTGGLKQVTDAIGAAQGGAGAAI